MVPVAPVITVIMNVFTFYVQCISTAMSLCILTSFRLASWSHFNVLKLQCLLTDMFLVHCHTLGCLVYCEGWLSVSTCSFTLISWLVSTDSGTYSYQWSSIQFLAHVKVQVSTHQHHLLHHRSNSTLCVIGSWAADSAHSETRTELNWFILVGEFWL